jgi:xanthine/uracil permease
MPPTKLPPIVDPQGPLAMVLGMKLSPSGVKNAGGSCVVMGDDHIGGNYGCPRSRS